MIVYTAIFNNRDRLFIPQSHGSDVVYACISDGMTVSCKEWDLKRMVCRMSPEHCTSYYQAHSTVYFPGEITIWHYSNVRLSEDPSALAALVSGDHDIAVLKHPYRDCIYEEADVSLRWLLDSPAVIRNQIARYRTMGYPEHGGLSAPYVIVRRDTPAVRRFEELWWNEMDQGSARDTLSFDYACWKTGLSVATITPEMLGDPHLYGMRGLHCP